MSADIVGDDWKPIGSEQVLNRVMRQLNAKGRGIILLHDIQKRTVDMVPALLHALKTGGYKVVHIVPSARDTRTALALAEPPANARIRTALASMRSEASAFAELSAPTKPVPFLLAVNQLPESLRPKTGTTEPTEVTSPSVAQTFAATPSATRLVVSNSALSTPTIQGPASNGFVVLASTQATPSFEELGLRR